MNEASASPPDSQIETPTRVSSRRSQFAVIAVIVAAAGMFLADWLFNRPAILTSPWRDTIFAQLLHVLLVYVVAPIALVYAIYVGATSFRRRRRSLLAIGAAVAAIVIAFWAILGIMPSGAHLGDRLLGPHITPYGEEPRPQPAPWYEVTLDVAPESKGEGVAVDYGLAQELNGEPVIGYAIVAKGVGRVSHSVEVRNGATVKVLDFDGVEIPVSIDARQYLKVGNDVSVPVAHGWIVLVDFTPPRGPSVTVRGKSQTSPSYVLIPLGRKALGGQDVVTDILSRDPVKLWLQLK